MLGDPRIARFVTEYLRHGDGKKALITCGWQGKNPGTAANRLLRKPGVRREIMRELENVRDATRVTKSYVVAHLKRVAERSMQEVPVLDSEGNETGEYKFDSSGANRSLELLGKTLGIFIEKQITVTMSLEELVTESMKLTEARDGT